MQILSTNIGLFYLHGCVFYFRKKKKKKDLKRKTANSAFESENEKVEGEELQEWLKMVVAPAELTIFIGGKQESIQPLQIGSG